MSIVIEDGSEWVDMKGKPLKVLSVDHDNDKLVFNRPDSPEPKRTVSIKVFTEQVKPIDYQPAYAVEVVKDIVNKTLTRNALTYELPSRFGKSPSLQLSNQDWLEQGMHAKTVKFNIGQGGLPPEVNWEDHCAAIAMIDDAPAKALASILLWGSDTNWDWSRQFDEVVQNLAAKMVERCKKDGRAAPQACSHTLPELARLMARMILHFELYELWDDYTVKGRLRFSGIETNASTYTNAWLTYQRQMTHDLFDMVGKADNCVSVYRQQLAGAH